MYSVVLLVPSLQQTETEYANEIMIPKSQKLKWITLLRLILLIQ